MSPLLLKRLSDESLGSRLASGEAAAFDELYRRYVHRLAAYGAHLLGDAASGDDVAQATLLKAYGTLRAGKLPERLRPWLYRIAHNAAIDVVKRRRELPAAELPDRPAADGAQEAGGVVAALFALPERQRHVYVLRELHGLRIDETAAELGMTVPQVEQALFAARNRMAEHLVFGDRLNCVAVQRLAAGPLELDERRALKTHLRSCPECRRAAGASMPAFTWLPYSPVGWLRGLGGIAGGGAPLAAKVGAVVATATIAAGVPVAIETTHLHLYGRSNHTAGHPARSTAAAATDPARFSTPAVIPVAYVRHHRTSTVASVSTPVAPHRVVPAAGAPTGAITTHDPVDDPPATSPPPTTTTTGSDDGPGENPTGDRGGSGDGNRSGTDGGTTEPTDDQSGSGDDTTQTETTPFPDGGTEGSGGGGSTDSGSSDSVSPDIGTAGGDGGGTGENGGTGGDGGSGGDAPPPPGD